VGQRASVLIHTDKPGAHWIRSALGLDQMLYFGPDTSNTTLAVLRYGCDEHTMPAISPEDAVKATGGLTYGDGGAGEPGNPDEPSWSDKAPTVGPLTRFKAVGAPAPPPSTQTIYTELSVGTNHDGLLRIQINNHSWTPMESDRAAVFFVQDGQEIGNDNGRERGTQFNMINTDPGAVIDVIIQTPFGPAHPFHLHGHNVWIMAQGQGKYEGTTNQLPTDGVMYRDVAVVPGSKDGAHLIVRFKADNPGVWPYHCHMQWHMMLGLLMSLTSLPDQIQHMDIPGREFCKMGH
jgi:iron transport multicopper oxidase